MKKILVLNGPNLDMLGVREPGIYGTDTLKSIEEMVTEYGSAQDACVTCFQSNSEGALIDTIHEARGHYDGIVYNPGAHTHYSYAIRDALSGIDVPCVEVHISDVDSREAFRAVSVIAPICVAQIKGMGTQGYIRAIDLLLLNLQEKLGEDYKTTATTGSIVVPKADISRVAEMLSSDEREKLQSQVIASSPVAGDQEDSVGQTLDDRVKSALNLTLPIDTESICAQLPLSASETEEENVRDRNEGRISTRIGNVVANCAGGGPEASDVCEQESASIVDALSELAFLVPSVPPTNSLASATRIAALRRLNEEQERMAFLVRDTSNIAWLTAFDDVFDEESAHALLITPHEATLHTDSRYYEATSNAAASCGVVSVDAAPVNHALFVSQRMEAQEKPSRFKRGKGYSLGIEDSMMLSDYRSLQRAVEKNKIPVVLEETSNAIVRLRAIKDRTEIERMKIAQAITDAAFAHIVAFIRPGITEKEVQIELEDFMLRHGASGLAFPSIVACGANASRPHCIPGSTKLESGQCVVLDFGARVFGYNSDMTRTVFLGEPSDVLKQAYGTIREANETVERTIRPGVTGKEMHELAEKILADNGFAHRMGHGLGHGVGIDIHELPVLSPRNPRPLQPGNVVTVEPGIYIEGSFGMRLEDFGVVTENGFEVFTKSTHEPVIL